MLLPEVAYLPEDEAHDGGPVKRRRRPGRVGKVLLGLTAAVLLVAGGAGSAAWAAGTFSDVPTTHPFYGSISWMAMHEISTGYGDGTYKPNDAVSRQAMSAFMRRLNFETSLVSVTIPAGSADAYEATAVCPTGKNAIAGGGTIDSSNLFMTDSYPVNGNGWKVRWESANDQTVDSGGKVWALCKPNNSQS